MSSGNTMPARWIENLHPDSSSSDPLVTTNIDLLSAEILLTLTTFGAHEASRQRLTTLFRGHISTYTSISASVCQLDAAIEVRSREIADSASGVQRLALRMGVLVWERVLQPWDAGEIDERFEMGKLALRDYEVALREIEGRWGC
ncbi:hypothetical protein N0V86_006659 [Didymella sp. IMI 355093]|nr:hypothetical protein N0V86_006659 [Didymella sp. IMI 355093]